MTYNNDLCEYASELQMLRTEGQATQAILKVPKQQPEANSA